MSPLHVATYALGCLYPSPGLRQPVVQTIHQLQRSGFTTVHLGMFHIGRNYNAYPAQVMGDLYLNNVQVFSQGDYVGHPRWPELMGALTGGSLVRVCASVGGAGPVLDFQTIKRIHEENGGSLAGSNLEKSFAALKAAVPSISNIDMDCEETYDLPSFIAFCKMLMGLGFGVTFCPYSNASFWAQSLAALNADNPGGVKGWNLQCYCGGVGNDPALWASRIENLIPAFDSNGFIVAGDWTDHSPARLELLLGSFKGKPCVGGAFVWELDSMLSKSPTDPLGLMKAYVHAVQAGLG